MSGTSWAAAYDVAVVMALVGLVALAFVWAIVHGPGWLTEQRTRAAEFKFMAGLYWCFVFAVPGYEEPGTMQNPSDPSPRPRGSR